MPADLENPAVVTGMERVSFHSNRKERRCQRMFKLPHNCTHLTRYLEKEMAPTPVLLPRKFHGRRSLMGCSPWGREELDTTERLHFHFSLSCIGEGNGNPLWWAWWAAVSGVAQSHTWLKQLSSSSSTHYQSNAQNSPSQASTVSELWTSRCSSCI